jgi:hypothetical protein
MGLMNRPVPVLVHLPRFSLARDRFPPMTNTFDVIFVGSGISSLVGKSSRALHINSFLFTNDADGKVSYRSDTLLAALCQ